jgi:hypothetical protein
MLNITYSLLYMLQFRKGKSGCQEYCTVIIHVKHQWKGERVSFERLNNWERYGIP